MKYIQSAILATSLLGIMSANAEPTGLLYGKLTGETPFDQAWSGFTLHKDDDNQILQEFSLQGRLQVQSIFGESDDDSFNTSDYKANPAPNNDETVWGNDIEARRARIGFKSKWFRNWKFDGLINVDVDGMDNAGDDTFYKDIYELFVSYAPSDALNVSVGKTKVRFTREQEISSNQILTIERSLISNTLFPGELTGIWTNGKGIADHWLYEAGFYGNDRQREFTNLSSDDRGTIFLAKIGYDYSEQSGLDSAVASVHFMNNTEPAFKEPNSPDYTTGTSPNFKSSWAFTNDITQGRFGLTTEAMLASGDGTQSDVMGLTVIPSYYIAEGLQLVGRLQVATSDDSDDLRVPSRYERLVAGDDELGNTYTSVYAGINYYIYGHKLKLMNGVEYSHLGGGDYDGYTLMSGLRFSF
jgi:phosphate-selective porin OprO/OprP